MEISHGLCVTCEVESLDTLCWICDAPLQPVPAQDADGNWAQAWTWAGMRSAEPLDA